MSFFRSAFLLTLGFWAGLTYVQPARGWALAATVGRGVARAGDKLVAAAEKRVHARSVGKTGWAALHASKPNRASVYF